MVDSKKSSEILENSNVSFWRAFGCSEKGIERVLYFYQKGQSCFSRLTLFENEPYPFGFDRKSKGYRKGLSENTGDTLSGFRHWWFQSRIVGDDVTGRHSVDHGGVSDGDVRNDEDTSRIKRNRPSSTKTAVTDDGIWNCVKHVVCHSSPAKGYGRKTKRVSKGYGTFIKRVWACFRCLTLFEFAPNPFRNLPKLKGVGTFLVRVPRVRARIHLHLHSSEKSIERTRARDGPRIKNR